MNERRPVLWLCLALALSTPPTAAQLSPLLVRGPYLQSGTPDSLVVRWRTDVPTDSRVRFGLAPDALDRHVDDPLLAVDHQVLVTGLSPATRYYYSIGSTAQALAGADADHSFVTAPLPGTHQSVRIWAFGDAGDDPTNEPQRRVRDGYLKFAEGRRTDVWLLLGDNAYTLANDVDYQTDLFESYPTILRQTVVWPTFGNHEAFSANPENQLGAYFDIFTLPTAGEAGGVPSGTESYYSFDHANIHFISLNSEVLDREITGPMLTWLRQDLAANTQDWTIAYFHRPVYSKGSHDSDRPTDSLDQSTAMKDLRERVLPILEESGVDLVLTGHSHSYERSYLLDGHYGTSDTFSAEMQVDDGDGDPNGDGPYAKTDDLSADAHAGAVYAVVGTGEENTGGTLDHPAMVTSLGDRTGTLVIDVDGKRLDAVFVDANGNPTDPFTIIKGTANLAPYARDDRALTETGDPVTLAVLANDRDPNHDSLTLASVGHPEHGVARGNADGTLTYTPFPNFAGTDGFLYTVSDGRGGTDAARVVVDVVCPAEISFADDLEPAAEPGWKVETAVNDSPSSAPWSLVSHPEAHSPEHGWSSQAGEETLLKDDRLVSPPQRLTLNSRLTFWHRFDLEQSFDGGVLEISEDGGATWIDLGPYIRESSYTGTTSGSNPIGPRPAWTGTSPGMVPVEVDLGAFAGEGRLLRWRLGCDDFTLESRAGWLVDDIQVTAAPAECGR